MVRRQRTPGRAAAAHPARPALAPRRTTAGGTGRPRRDGAPSPPRRCSSAAGGPGTATAARNAERGQRAPRQPPPTGGGPASQRGGGRGGSAGPPRRLAVGACEGGKASAPSRSGDAADPPRGDRDAVNAPSAGGGDRCRRVPPPLSRPGAATAHRPLTCSALRGAAEAAPSRRRPPRPQRAAHPSPGQALPALIAPCSPPARRSRGSPRGAGTYRPRGGDQSRGGTAGPGAVAQAQVRLRQPGPSLWQRGVSAGSGRGFGPAHREGRAPVCAGAARRYVRVLRVPLGMEKAHGRARVSARLGRHMRAEA